MNTFRQARRPITLIVGLLEQFGDKQLTKSENRNFILPSLNFHTVQSMLLCEFAYSASEFESSFIWWKI